jgi:hypothetical protein
MTPRTFSERLFEEFCATNALQCARVPEGADPTPDYQVMFGDVVVACEVKQVDPNAEDLEELRTIGSGAATGRFVPNRLSGLLGNPRLHRESIRPGVESSVHSTTLNDG